VGERNEMVNNMMMMKMMVKSDNKFHRNDLEQKPQTHYFKHGYVTFSKHITINQLSQFEYFVWIWIENREKLILMESGKIQNNN
jgi:hypothetical protein